MQLLTNDHRNLGKFTRSRKFRGKVSKKCPIHNRLPSKQIQLSVAFITLFGGHYSRPEATWKRNCRSYRVDCIKKKLRLSRQNALKHTRTCSTTSSDQQPPSYLDKRRTRSQQRPHSTHLDTPTNWQEEWGACQKANHSLESRLGIGLDVRHCKQSSAFQRT
jgi:hypothetical protein